MKSIYIFEKLKPICPTIKHFEFYDAASVWIQTMIPHHLADNR